MAISPMRASRCCSKYVFSWAPMADADRGLDAMVSVVGAVWMLTTMAGAWGNTEARFGRGGVAFGGGNHDN